MKLLVVTNDKVRKSLQIRSNKNTAADTTTHLFMCISFRSDRYVSGEYSIGYTVDLLKKHMSINLGVEKLKI